MRREWGPDETKEIKYAKKDITVVKELHRKTMNNKEKDREMPFIQRCKKQHRRERFHSPESRPWSIWTVIGFPPLALISAAHSTRFFSVRPKMRKILTNKIYRWQNITVTGIYLPGTLSSNKCQKNLTKILNKTLNDANRVRSTFINKICTAYYLDYTITTNR